MPQVLLTEPIDVHARLHELQVKEEQLTGAIAAGLAAKANCTATHPANYPGIAMWAETVRALRDALLNNGWVSADSKGVPLVLRGDGLVAICVASGDEGTGSVDDEIVPSTRYSKGVAIVGIVERNMLLPFDHIPEIAHDGSPTSTWFLLHSRKGNEIICELSHPVSMNESGFVDEWDERILLTSIPLDPARMPVLEAPPVESEVVIRRREA